MKMQTARSVSEDVARRPLMGAEVVRFAQAKTRLAKAQEKIDAKEYEAGDRLVTAAMADLQAVIDMNDKRVHATPQPAPQPKPVPQPVPQPKPVPQPQPPQPQPPQPQPQPIPQPPQPQPQPAPQPPQPQPQPQPEAAEKQISAFMQKLGAAYQAKDVNFFREHALNFNDAFAAAIRNSPSVKVELQVEHIDVHDAQHATVNVRRTDQFSDARMPAGVQELAYHLERTANGWELAYISKQ